KNPIGYAPRAQAIPQSHEMDGDGPAVDLAEFHGVGGVGAPAGAIEAQGLAVAPGSGSLQQPEIAQQPHAGAGAVGPPAGTEQPDFVPRLVVVDEEAVQLEDVPIEARGVRCRV